MYDEIKAKLDEEIMDQLSVLSDMDVAVSYTHLDVYKRQVLGCLPPGGHIL